MPEGGWGSGLKSGQPVGGILVVEVLHGLSPEELRSDISIPIFLLERNLINLNDIQRYFEQLRRGVGEQREDAT